MSLSPGYKEFDINNFKLSLLFFVNFVFGSFFKLLELLSDLFIKGVKDIELLLF